MTSRSVAVAAPKEKKDDFEFSFFEALTFDGEDTPEPKSGTKGPLKLSGPLGISAFPPPPTFSDSTASRGESESIRRSLTSSKEALVRTKAYKQSLPAATNKPLPKYIPDPVSKSTVTTHKTLPAEKPAAIISRPHSVEKSAAINTKATPSEKSIATVKPLPVEKPTAAVKSTPQSNMSTSKAQTMCLELCHKTTQKIDHISVHILECLTSTKQLPEGFNQLAHDFLDTCQILFAIEAGLEEFNRTAQKFPSEMLNELNTKFRVTQADFQILDQMLGKLLGSSSKMKRGWNNLFGHDDVRKISQALAKTRESLRMSSLMFQWSLGDEKVSREMGIGYTALSAALDRMDHKAGAAKARSPQSSLNNGSQLQLQTQPQPQSQPGMMDRENSYHQQQLQQHQMQQNQMMSPHQSIGPWSNRSSSIRHQDQSMDMSPINDHRQPWNSGYQPSPGSEFRGYSGITTLTGATSPSSMDKQYFQNIDTHEVGSNMDDRHSLAAKTESDGFAEDLAALDIGHGKVTRIDVDPSTMPRSHARPTPESESANMKAALISAVRSKNHKLMEQLLHRGVSPNAGPNMHALNEAILTHDEESVRILLVFGADPNDPARDGATPLFAAAKHSFIAGATTLLKYGADPNLVAGPDLESPLAVAASANMAAFTHLLLTYNGDPNHVNAEGDTIIISAINKKTPKKFVDLLLEYGSDPNTKSRKGETPLFEALQVGRADIVTSLLDHGADPNLPGPKHMLWPSVHYSPCLQILLAHGADHKKCPGIMELATSTNNMDSIRLLLKAGVNPNLKKDGIYTPLCTAIRDDRGEILRLLLANGADPNVMASEYPAFKCVTHNRLHFLPTLIAAGADLNKPKGILETAVASKNHEALIWLLDQGINPNDKTPKGMSPLSTAIREDHIEMVDVLLQRGADPHMRGEDWPLCMAVRNPPILKRILKAVEQPQAFKGVMEMAVSANQLESVKLLLAAGVSVEDRNGGVFSPLTTALRENRRHIVVYLLTEGGADVNSPGEHLPVVKALRRFHGEDTEMLELLMKHGADPNKLYRGWNGFMQAVENGDADVLQMMCQKTGVDLETKDELGRTLVEMAGSRGWQEAVQILKEGDIRLRR